MDLTRKKIALIGGGPSSLFMFKRLIESGHAGQYDIHIFERTQSLGMGMPYSRYGANMEHITNVSDNEIPLIVNHFEEWLADAPTALKETFQLVEHNHNPYKVLPRLFFGEYLHAQFELLIAKAKAAHIRHTIHLETEVTDMHYQKENGKCRLVANKQVNEEFDIAVICTGHHWPKSNETQFKNYFDSPYPPIKLQLVTNHPVAITGSSLTAIDALRTLARANGHFEQIKDGTYQYHKNAASENFKLVVHSLHGVFPGMRFHLHDTNLKDEKLLDQKAIDNHIENNGGFLSLDFIFEQDFKAILKTRDPKTYRDVKNMTVEDFAAHFQGLLEATDAIAHLKQDYKRAERSIAEEKSLHWREILAMLSFAINYPAKHFSAEDKIRLDQVLMPLISHVIAFIPQGSAREVLALADAGVLEIVKVGRQSKAVPHAKGGANYHIVDQNGHKKIVYYRTYVSCMGQPQWEAKDFIFPSLWNEQIVSPATFTFSTEAAGLQYYKGQRKKAIRDQHGNVLMLAKGVKINDNFQLVDATGAVKNNLYLMAVPHMGGYNPDYSGLDFGEEASRLIQASIDQHGGNNGQTKKTNLYNELEDAS